jgi:hypothetical protein
VRDTLAALQHAHLTPVARREAQHGLRGGRPRPRQRGEQPPGAGEADLLRALERERAVGEREPLERESRWRAVGEPLESRWRAVAEPLESRWRAVAEPLQSRWSR